MNGMLVLTISPTLKIFKLIIFKLIVETYQLPD